MKLMIYGAGGQGRVLLRMAREINIADKRWDEIVFVDDVTSEKNIMEQRVFPFAKITKDFDPDTVEFVISLGEPVHRRTLYDRIKNAGYCLCEPLDLNKDNIKYNHFGKGVVIGNKALLSNNVSLADNTYVSNTSSIGHDTTVGNHSFVCGGVVIGGGCTIGNGTFIGLNATIRDHITIGSNVIVSMGACVFKDLPDNVKVMGNPAKAVPNFAGHRIFS